ncbi:MAG: hypothetical protein R8F63_00495 [Acidimicrobiales bacterium]|nr:hypothetical protein [Acidimicrobiales bacterium]
MSTERSNELVIEYLGETHVVSPDRDFTFGRAADLSLDADRTLHRVLGRFIFRQGLWWVRNEGRTIPVTLVDRESRSRLSIDAGREAVLTFANSTVRFQARKTPFEFEVRQTVVSSSEADGTGDPAGTETTVTAGRVPLTDDQRLALVMLAKDDLEDPHRTGPMRSNAEMARSLGWKLSRFNRKIDNLCAKFSRAGVPGLRGSTDQLAIDRRSRLVEHCLATRIVSRDDLALLEAMRPTETSPETPHG